MIKVRIQRIEFTLNRNRWTSEEYQNIADLLNLQSGLRPFCHEVSEEWSIAQYIVAKYKDRGAEIIYDSEAELYSGDYLDEDTKDLKF